MARVGESRARRHRFKVNGERFYRNLRGNIFTQRVVGVWNVLPEEVIEAGTNATFKKQLDKFIDNEQDRANVEGFALNADKWDQC